ncbi:MAG: hypothetical protein ACYTDE_02615 [Planctomycetota bacterium]|jgi:hypothetical protein
MSIPPRHPGPASLTSRGGRGRFWESVMQWAISVDHKKLALMYIGAGLCFFLVAGLGSSSPGPKTT